MNYGDSLPYMQHCIVLDTCDVPSNNIIIESYQTEREVLTAWTELIKREDPDIIIGYNIFGFDYSFMFERAKKCNCIEDFLELSRNKNEICNSSTSFDTLKYKLKEINSKMSGGSRELQYIKMNGRLQIDLYRYFRKEENLPSYKLDYVSGHFIGDYILNILAINTI